MAGNNIISRATTWVSNLFQRRSFTVLNDYFRWQSYSKGDFTPITNEDFLSIPAVLAGIRMTAETVAAFPLPLFHLDGKNRSEATTHPAWSLWRKPNQSQTEMSCRSMLVAYSLIDGYAYGYIDRDHLGNAVGIIPFARGEITTDPQFPGLFFTTSEAGQKMPIAEQNVFVLESFLGRGLAALCSTSLELTKAAETFAKQMFKNGCRPGGILMHPKPLTREARERLRQEFEGVHQGEENAFRVMVAAEGMTWMDVTGAANDAQAVEQRRFQAEEVSRIIGIPLAKLGLAPDPDPEATNVAWLQSSIIPLCKRFEQASSLKCLLPGDQDRYYWKHNFNSLLRASTLNRSKYFAVARNWGWLSVNEIRALEDMDRLPGDAGDQYLSPVNMSPLVPDLGSPGARAPAGESPVEDSELGLLPPQVGDPAAPTTTPGAGAPGAGSIPAPAAAASADVASTALDGAQISSLLEIVNQLATGLIPVESAKSIAQASFPFLPDSTIGSIFDPVRVAKNVSTDAVPQRGPGQTVQQPGE